MNQPALFFGQRKDLFLTGLATGYFWLFGLIFLTNTLVYSQELLRPAAHPNALLALLLACLGLGIAVGIALVGRWSGQKIELGLVPLGGFGLFITGLGLYFSSGSYIGLTILSLLSGICAALFVIPLYAYLVFKSELSVRGQVLATAGLLAGLFLLGSALLYYLLAVTLALSPRTIYLSLSLLTAGVVIYICTIIPEYFIRFLGWLLTHTIYQIEIIGVEHVPARGPALLTPNHVSFIDAFLIGATVQRFVRFVMLKKFYEVPLFKPVLKLMDAIPIAPYEGKESVARSLSQAREKLQQGHVVCIFPEGKLTEDGQLNEFRPGFETIMAGLDCPIIPVYMHNVWGSIFSFEGNRFFWKWPKRLPYPISIRYGQPLPATAKAQEVAQAVQALAEETALALNADQSSRPPISSLTKPPERV